MTASGVGSPNTAGLRNEMNLWKWSGVLIGVFVISLIAGVAGLRELKKLEAKGDPARGREIFLDHCQLCHDASTNQARMGPGLKGLFQMPPHKMSDGTEHTVHTEAMIREQIVKGSRSMPPWGSNLSEKDLDNLMAYLKTL